MKLLNNPEIRKFLLITVIPSLLLCFIVLFFSEIAAVCVFLVSAFLLISFLIFTKLRYARIARLEDNIDKILHGNEKIDIKSFGEGELSILESDVQKMLVLLRDRNDKLEKERVFLSDSIADISHQLRTPLTSINLILSLIQSGDISEERKSELLRELSSLIAKTEYLVSVLLKISKLDAGIVKFDKKETSLKALLEKSAEALLVPMDIRNQSLVIDADNIELNCDSSWCLEAFGNILKNCTEHTPENGIISIKATDTPIFTQLVISDTGTGFNDDDISHLFDRFYKGKNSSKESFGIGLNFAKMIITSHNGTISAKNSETGGAEFTVRFYKQVV